MKRKIYIETYGCQMNLADTEIILGILSGEDYAVADDPETADAVFLNTCAIRENAEQRIRGRIAEYKSLKKRRPRLILGVLGCMAERLREQLVKKHGVDVVCGPDEYRRLPLLIDRALEGEAAVGTQLSRSETYEDVVPLRKEGVCAWLAVMRGCDKFCSYCVVPFTRGRERSRRMASILREVRQLAEGGVREVTLLGQNVNSWRDEAHDFADLLGAVAGVDRGVRVRFATSHPQDLSPRLIDAMAGHRNVCSSLHLPVQSGADRILELMNRSYTRAAYLALLSDARSAIDGLSVSTDIIAGFPTEKEEDHILTLELMQEVRFDSAFTFIYSPRENTRAFKLGDDVAAEVKHRRLQEIIELQRRHSVERNRQMTGRTEEVLVEGPSKRSSLDWMGRTDGNKTVVFSGSACRPGDILKVRIDDATSATLFGTVQSEAREAAAA